MSLSVQNNNYSYLIAGSKHLKEQPVASDGSERKLQEVWSSYNFEPKSTTDQLAYNTMSWASSNNADRAVQPVVDNGEEAREPVVDVEERDDKLVADAEDKEDTPSHHARRPMNAFLIFCKKHRPVVRQRFATLENRGVTKILGEWWALLQNEDKQPYTDLAKEYKDAFLSANPDFKWYKLPAPARRTLATRPIQPKTSTPHTSPSLVETPASPTYTAEFTPGKLADESQLGGLTSLMNNNFATSKDANACCKLSENNNNNEPEGYITPPDTSLQLDTPPKPPKKRFLNDNANAAFKRNLTEDEPQMDVTNQDLLNKVVDNCFTNSKLEDDYDAVRKSDRSCKGKRYEQFMYENKLMGNKKDTRLTQQKIKPDADAKPAEPETPKLDLSTTIKRLAERTNTKLPEEAAVREPPKRERTVSEMSDTDKTPSNDFQLDLRISNLPSLSYEEYMVRKRESKKRKSRIKPEHSEPKRHAKVHNTEQPIGSKKRKNKQSITHLNKAEAAAVVASPDLMDLATLAEVAANTEKMQQ